MHKTPHAIIHMGFAENHWSPRNPSAGDRNPLWQEHLLSPLYICSSFPFPTSAGFLLIHSKYLSWTRSQRPDWYIFHYSIHSGNFSKGIFQITGYFFSVIRSLLLGPCILTLEISLYPLLSFSPSLSLPHFPCEKQSWILNPSIFPAPVGMVQASPSSFLK